MAQTATDITPIGLDSNGRLRPFSVGDTLIGGGGGTLADTLGAGNTTGGTDIVLSSGDAIRGATGSGSTPGVSVEIFGGDSDPGENAGSLDLSAGSTDYGADATMRGGNGTHQGGSARLYAGESPTGDPAKITLDGNEETGDGGDIDIWPGSDLTTGGDLNLHAGGSTTQSGVINLYSGDGNPRITVTDDGVMLQTVYLLTGSGDPENSLAAPVGSLYLRTDGGAGTTLYVKESGTGNTGWAGK